MVEMKLLIILTLFCIARGDINSFVGDWAIALAFPDPPMVPICGRIAIGLAPSTCICNGTTVPVTTTRPSQTLFGLPGEPLTFPTIVVNSSEEIAGALRVTCQCDGRKHQQIVFRRINDNCFAQYETHGKHEKEPHASLLVKNSPKTLRELEDSCKTDDLKDRVGYMMCPSMFSE